MSPVKVTIVDPAAEDVAERLALAPHTASLRGARVALIDNSKHNADRFLATLAMLLVRDQGVAGTAGYRRAGAGVRWPPGILPRLLEGGAAAGPGVADWGWCVTWGLHDSVQIEKAGRPAVTVVTEAFKGAAAARAAVLG